MCEKRSEYKVLVGKREGNRPHGPRRPRFEDNIEMHFKELPWKSVGLDLSASLQGRLWGFCEHGNELSGFVTYGEYLDRLKTASVI
jgi:hypothetical protein